MSDKVCDRCNKIHGKNKLCEDIIERFNRIVHNKNKTYFWGNVILKCLENNINFIDLYKDIMFIQVTEDNCVAQYNKNFPSLNLNENAYCFEGIINYIANYIGCDISELFINSKHLGEKIVSYISSIESAGGGFFINLPKTKENDYLDFHLSLGGIILRRKQTKII